LEVEMQRTGVVARGLLVAAAGVAGLTAAFAVAANGSSGARVVMTAKNKTLGKTILVNRSGMTLYSLSVERHGRFICKNAACLAVWKPLVVAKGVKPTGVRGLATIKRPDHRIQVTYRGAPLYRFTGDHKRGDVNGNGFKDVGTWRVVTVAGSGSTGTTTAPPPTYTYPG
jgi:predicted lipoprotein with Yx(FWY)xxD motif